MMRQSVIYRYCSQPDLGVGVGCVPNHTAHLTNARDSWFEVISENL